jgi:L-asparagine transporter-like permease
MLFRRQVEQVIEQQRLRKTKPGLDHSSMDWWDLSLIGVGAVIGAGFFLGTALSIQRAGLSILLAYIIGGLIAFKVFSSLAEMSTRDPQEGSFRVYARKAFGPQIGFTSGWMYWLAGVLIMSTEVTALAIFSQFWFPTVPLWVFAASYSALALAINLLGVNDFGKIESLFGVIKISALIIFIIFGLLVASGAISLIRPPASNPGDLKQWFPAGLTGLWSALVFVLFSYGGIEVMGILSHELKQYKDIGKSGKVMLTSLTAVYALALLFIFLMVPGYAVSTAESPFVTALSTFGFGFADSLLNIIIISAAFSTMVGALFGVTNVLVSLANDLDAPLLLAWRNNRGVPVPALSLTGLGLLFAIVMSFLLPNTVYEYLATSAGVMLILNWIIILLSNLKLDPHYASQHLGITMKRPTGALLSYVTIGLIILTIAGATIHLSERIGVLFSLSMASLIFISARIKELSGAPGGLVPARKPYRDD